MAQVVTPNSREVPKKLKIWSVLTDTSQALAPSFNFVFPFLKVNSRQASR